MESADKIERAWKNERKWFSRTFVASFVSVVCFFATMGIFWWGNRETAKISKATLTSSAPSDQQLDKMHSAISHVLLVSSASIILLVISGLVFLYFLIRWLIALKGRRSLGS